VLFVTGLELRNSVISHTRPDELGLPAGRELTATLRVALSEVEHGDGLVSRPRNRDHLDRTDGEEYTGAISRAKWDTASFDPQERLIVLW